jgi:transcriptional regulator with XRE-family HTH domain
MKDRILQFLAIESLSPTRFADQLGVQRSGVSHILAGRNKPSYDFIEKMLLTFPNINAEWLLLGKGEMYKAPTKAVPQTLSLFEEHPLQKEAATNTAPPNEKSDNEKNNTEKIGMEKAKTEKPVALQHFIAQKPDKTVENITIFYSDKTFCAYQPE